MSWLTNLFVGTDTAEKALDAAIKSGDALFYTEEEKADFSLKVKDWYIDLLSSMKPFNVAMRLLSVGVFLMWGMHLIISTSLYAFAFFVCEPDQSICLISEAASKIDNQMERHINDSFSTIIMFYFGAAGLNSAISAWKKPNK